MSACQHSARQYKIRRSIRTLDGSRFFMLSVVILHITFAQYNNKDRYAECHYTIGHSSECRGVKVGLLK